MVTGNTLSLFNENFNKLTPYAVGFDHIFDNLNRYVDNQQAQGFPPYNIRKEGDYHYVIEMALAGFGKKDIEIEVSDGTLSVRSTKENETDNDSQLYRGISFRKFDRRFTLSEDIVVQGASLENGMLTINLERIVPEEKKPRLIEVK